MVQGGWTKTSLLSCKWEVLVKKGKASARKSVSKYIISGGNPLGYQGDIVGEAQAKNFTQNGLCGRISRGAADEAKTDVFVVYVDDHGTTTCPLRGEATKSFKDR